MTSAAFDAETAAGQVAAALLPLADAWRAGRASLLLAGRVPAAVQPDPAVQLA